MLGIHNNKPTANKPAYSWYSCLFLVFMVVLDIHCYSWYSWLFLAAIIILGIPGYSWYSWLFLVFLVILGIHQKQAANKPAEVSKQWWTAAAK